MPPWLCDGQLNRDLGPVTEVAYNALHNRMQQDLPYTGGLTDRQRPAGMDLFNPHPREQPRVELPTLETPTH
jgi:hypothetical protein